MTSDAIFPRIQFHPVFILFASVAVLSGAMVELFIIICIVCIHELGHYSAARFFRWRIRRIYMWIFGAIMETDEHGIRPIYEELIVVLSGPLQHGWIYLVAFMFQQYGVFPPGVIESIFFYNTVILVFNLLPIWPLDGGKILYLLLTSIYPYQKGYERTLIYSQIGCIVSGILVLGLVSFHIQLVFMIGFLWLEIWREWRRKQYVFMRFLLHRLHGQPYMRDDQLLQLQPSTPVSDVFTKLRREKESYILMKDDSTGYDSRSNPFHERICLQYYFYQDGFSGTIADVYASQFKPARLHVRIK